MSIVGRCQECGFAYPAHAANCKHAPRAEPRAEAPRSEQVREQIGRVKRALLHEHSQRAETLFRAASGLCIAAGAMLREPRCECHLHERQVCDICQGLADGWRWQSGAGPAVDKPVEAAPAPAVPDMSREVVVRLMDNDDDPLVVHLPYPECEIGEPHRNCNVYHRRGKPEDAPAAETAASRWRPPAGEKPHRLHPDAYAEIERWLDTPGQKLDMRGRMICQLMWEVDALRQQLAAVAGENAELKAWAETAIQRAERAEKQAAGQSKLLRNTEQANAALYDRLNALGSELEQARADLAQARAERNRWGTAYARSISLSCSCVCHEDGAQSIAAVEVLREQLAQARTVLRRIADHDHCRYDWVDDVAVSKPSPQEIAREYLEQQSQPPAPARGESREEFERDRFGETGDRLRQQPPAPAPATQEPR